MTQTLTIYKTSNDSWVAVGEYFTHYESDSLKDVTDWCARRNIPVRVNRKKVVKMYAAEDA